MASGLWERSLVGPWGLAKKGIRMANILMVGLQEMLAKNPVLILKRCGTYAEEEIYSPL